MEDRRFYRSRADKMFLGVFSGLARYLNVDVAFVRIVAVLLAIFTNVPFLIIYFVVAFCTKEQ